MTDHFSLFAAGPDCVLIACLRDNCQTPACRVDTLAAANQWASEHECAPAIAQ